MKKRAVPDFGVMSYETLEIIVKKAIAAAQESCVFAFQGGEPTLAGLAFFRRLIELEQKYNTKGLIIHNTLQTNGYRLDAQWAAFFAEHRFLIGLSIDGIQSTHDRYRRTAAGNGTFTGVLNTARLFDEYHVEYNILTVVNAETAPCIDRIYAFFKKRGFRYLQFIPCLDPLGEPPGKDAYSLTAEAYGTFLCRLFELWYADYQNSCQPSIREFENYIAVCLGFQPELCSMRGFCGIQNVVEADGSVYPCDFYVTGAYKLANLRTGNFDDIVKNARTNSFIVESRMGKDECRACPFGFICRGGCRRHRIIRPDGTLGENRFCTAYKQFFSEKLPYLKRIARQIQIRECHSFKKLQAPQQVVKNTPGIQP